MTSRDNDQDLARLLQEAGPRPEVPDERIAAAMAAVRPAWEAKLAEREPRDGRWRPFLLAAAMAGLALLAGWWARPFLAPAPTAAWVELAKGQSLADGHPLAVGAAVPRGASIEVEGLLALRLETGGSLRLDRGSRAHLHGPNELELEAGALYFDSHGNEEPTTAGSPAMTVATAWGTVYDIGTQFEVRLRDEGLTVRVREGEVELAREGGRHRALEGEELRLGSDGDLVRSPLPSGSETFAWAHEAAPPFDFESGDLPAFFRWASRETGKEPSWQPLDLEEEIETITFHGSVEGLTPLEALDVVAAATGLEVEIVGEEMEIRRAR